jgi:hypothetical protein
LCGNYVGATTVQVDHRVVAARTALRFRGTGGDVAGGMCGRQYLATHQEGGGRKQIYSHARFLMVWI